MATAKPTLPPRNRDRRQSVRQSSRDPHPLPNGRPKPNRAPPKLRVTAPRQPHPVFGDYAERAVLIPVGAALIARDRVMTSVNSTISSYSSSSKAQAQLRRFERRGTTARKRLEREVRKARVRFERELRQRRREIEKTVSDLEARREAVAKNGTELANRVPEIANRVPDLASQVQERILSLV